MSRSKVTSTLKYYLQTAWTAAGLEWLHENTLEVEEMVTNLFEEAKNDAKHEALQAAWDAVRKHRDIAGHL